MNCWLRELAYVPWDSETEVFPARHRCSLEHGADELRPRISSEIRVHSDAATFLHVAERHG